MIKVRENFYNFSHCSFPNIVFMYGKTIIERIIADKNKYIASLKRIWNTTPLEDKNQRRQPPNFDITIKQGTDKYSYIIISQPEAVKLMETPYICIAYDKDYNLRYFTYEVGKAENDRKVYFFCEWTASGSHVNYHYFDYEDMDSFIELVTRALALPPRMQNKPAAGTYAGTGILN